MPITDALKTARDLERAGLSPVVAQVLAEKFEETAQATHDSLKDFIRQEFTSLRAELGIKFAQIDGRFDQINGRFAQVEARFDQVNGRFAQVEARFDQVNGRFAQVDGKFAQLEGKMEGRFAQLEGKMEGRFGELEAKFERSLRMQLVAMIALASLAVAIIKLFPNLH
jgi:predicted nuclease with TOPRIM domain